MISPTCIMISPYSTQVTKDDIPHCPAPPPPLHGTRNILHMYHEIPYVTEHHPRYSRYPPTVLKIPLVVLNAPSLPPPSPKVLNIHYTVWFYIMSLSATGLLYGEM